MAKYKKRAEKRLAARKAAYEQALKTATRPTHFNPPGSMKK